MLDIKKLLSTIGQVGQSQVLANSNTAGDRYKAMSMPDEVTTTAPNMGMQIQPRPQMPLPTLPDGQPTQDPVGLPPLTDEQRQGMQGQPIALPQVGRPVPPTDLQQAQQNYESAVAEPSHKQGALAQGLNFGLQGLQKFADSMRGVKNDEPVRWLGDIKKQLRVDKAAQTLAPLQAQDKYQKDAEYRDAQAGKLRADAENLRRDDNDKFIQSIRKRKYYDPKQISTVERNRLATLGYKPEDLGSWDDRDPKTVKWGDAVWQYDNGKKAWVESGIAKDPTMTPETYEVDETDADGKVIKDANGNPVTRKFITTSKGGAALKEYANSRKASLRLGQDRLNETVRSGKKREDLAQKQFDFAKTKWNDTQRMHSEAQTRADAAKAQADASKSQEDILKAQKAQLEADRYKTDLQNMQVNWKKGIGTGGFTEDDYNELVGNQ